MEVAPHSVETEEVTVYERKDGNQEGRIPPPDPEIPKVILKQGSTVITRVTAQGESKGPVSHEMKTKQLGQSKPEPEKELMERP